MNRSIEEIRGDLKRITRKGDYEQELEAELRDATALQTSAELPVNVEIGQPRVVQKDGSGQAIDAEHAAILERQNASEEQAASQATVYQSNLSPDAPPNGY